jgi:magnesium-transporting ATPase (P-type)
MGFSVLVIAQLFNALNARSTHASAFHHPLGNVRLLAAIGLSLGLQVLVVHLPFLNQAFGTVPLSPADWLACIALASSVLWAEELRKLLARRGRPAITA